VSRRFFYPQSEKDMQTNTETTNPAPQDEQKRLTIAGLKQYHITQRGRLLAAELDAGDHPKMLGLCSYFMRLSVRAQRLAEDACNGPGDYVNRIPYPEAGKIYEAFEAKTAKAIERNDARLIELGALLPGVNSVRIDGDPRGTVVKLMRADGRYNTMGGACTGWAVPIYE
jgi:hypothetical protein